jgi:hypothetical protein
VLNLRDVTRTVFVRNLTDEAVEVDDSSAQDASGVVVRVRERTEFVSDGHRCHNVFEVPYRVAGESKIDFNVSAVLARRDNAAAALQNLTAEGVTVAARVELLRANLTTTANASQARDFVDATALRVRAYRDALCAGTSVGATGEPAFLAGLQTLATNVSARISADRAAASANAVACPAAMGGNNVCAQRLAEALSAAGLPTPANAPTFTCTLMNGTVPDCTPSIASFLDTLTAGTSHMKRGPGGTGASFGGGVSVQSANGQPGSHSLVLAGAALDGSVQIDVSQRVNQTLVSDYVALTTVCRLAQVTETGRDNITAVAKTLAAAAALNQQVSFATLSATWAALHNVTVPHAVAHLLDPSNTTSSVELLYDRLVITTRVQTFVDACRFNVSNFKPSAGNTLTAAQQAALVNVSAALAQACNDAQDDIAAAATQVCGCARVFTHESDT